MIPAVRMLLEERNISLDEAMNMRRQLIDLTSLIARKLCVGHGQPFL
jgi:hypothetical protein